MNIDDKIKDEKLQYYINKEVAKISGWSPGKMDKCEYYIGKQILPFDQNRTIEQEKFAYSPVRTTFEKQTKRIEEERKKQIDAITNQNKRLEALPDEYDHKSGYKEIFDKLIE